MLDEGAFAAQGTGVVVEELNARLAAVRWVVSRLEREHLLGGCPGERSTPLVWILPTNEHAPKRGDIDGRRAGVRANVDR